MPWGRGAFVCASFWKRDVVCVVVGAVEVEYVVDFVFEGGEVYFCVKTFDIKVDVVDCETVELGDGVKCGDL